MWIVVILLAVIGVAGYQVFPALLEVWHRSQPDRAAAENALRSTRITSQTSAPSPHTASTPDTNEAAEQSQAATPQSAPPQTSASDESSSLPKQALESAPPESKSAAVSPSTQESQNASAAEPPDKSAVDIPSGNEPAAPAALKRDKPLAVKETFAPANSTKTISAAAEQVNAAQNTPAPASPKPNRLTPTPTAAAWQTRISRILVQSGIQDQVRVAAMGNTLALSGKLPLSAHRRLLARLQDIPAHLQVTDDIDLAVESPVAPAGGGSNGASSLNPSR
jgi:hypothetical protein